MTTLQCCVGPCLAHHHRGIRGDASIIGTLVRMLSESSESATCGRHSHSQLRELILFIIVPTSGELSACLYGRRKALWKWLKKAIPSP